MLALFLVPEFSPKLGFSRQVKVLNAQTVPIKVASSLVEYPLLKGRQRRQPGVDLGRKTIVFGVFYHRMKRATAKAATGGWRDGALYFRCKYCTCKKEYVSLDFLSFESTQN
jgi:hypothetical protein